MCLPRNGTARYDVPAQLIRQCNNFGLRRSGMFTRSCWIIAVLAIGLSAAERPKIVGIANIAVKVSSLDEARKFYGGVVGMAEAFQTKDAEVPGELACFKVNDRQFVAVPARVDSDANGNRSFVVRDPDGHAVQFVQYMPGSVHTKDAGKHLASTRISDHMMHVGIWVLDSAKSDVFYKDVLGFRP